MTIDLAFLTIAEAAVLIKSRQLSPVEYVEALIKRTETFDPQLHAYITPTFDLARQQAKHAEHEIAAGTYRGPLHGIPFALKDIYDTKGIRTSGHSKVCLNRTPDVDATTTTKLYEAGAILIGKLATHEFAHGGPSFDLPWPPARNPWHLAHFTGGSSSGSGAAVAAGLVPMALGSDTGGSIRGPASLCGLAGLMPTFGLVSRGGVLPNSYTFDHCGPLARSVEDCAIVMQAIAGFDPKDAGSLKRDIPDYRAALTPDLKGLRIGVLRHNWEEDLPASENVHEAMAEALRVLKELGAEIENCRVRSLQHYFDIKVIIAETEIFSIHQQDLVARPGDFGADFRARALPAVLFTANDYVQATREHRHSSLQTPKCRYRHRHRYWRALPTRQMPPHGKPAPKRHSVPACISTTSNSRSCLKERPTRSAWPNACGVTTAMPTSQPTSLAFRRAFEAAASAPGVGVRQPTARTIVVM
jgi:aspartyl-tRNA(Asn)/glutamyl-tRNA(Gln) amidotransferase subunit A